MTRKQFKLIAQLISDFTFNIKPEVNQIIKENFAHSMAQLLKEENPRFDTKKFIDASCGRQ